MFLNTLQHYRHEGCYKLFAFVVMPDHVHLLLTPQGITLERTMQLVKAGFRIGSPQYGQFGSAAFPTTASAAAKTSTRT